MEAVEAVIETGRSSYTMVDVLEEMGVAVKIAHPIEALLKTYRHLETRIGESTAFVEKLYEESREAQLIRYKLLKEGRNYIAYRR